MRRMMIDSSYLSVEKENDLVGKHGDGHRQWQDKSQHVFERARRMLKDILRFGKEPRHVGEHGSGVAGSK